MTTQNVIENAYSATPTASFIAKWDANVNISANNALTAYTTTATAAATTTLTVASTYSQFFTGSTTQTVTLPVTSTLVLGFPFYIVNNSSGNVTIQSSGGNTVQVMAGGTTAYLTCILTSGTTAASWNCEYAFNGGEGSGTVNNGTANDLAYYQTTGTAVSALSTLNSAGLLTNGSGVPAWVAYTGTGAPVLANSPAFVAGASFGSVGNPGSLQLFPTTASKGYLYIVPANNSANYQVEITNASFGQTSTLTIPDPGAASANFVLTGSSNSNGGIYYSTSNEASILAGTTTARQMLQSGASGAPAWSTTTYPATNAINTLLYASSANVMAALATANSSVLVTSSGGVPSLSTTLPAALTIPQPVINGFTDASTAGAGVVGQVISSTVSYASAVTVSATATPQNLTSISLTAGDWDIWGNIYMYDSIAGDLVYTQVGISTTTATFPDNSLVSGVGNGTYTISALTAPMITASINSTTTYYLVGQANTIGGTVKMCGAIYARRRR